MALFKILNNFTSGKSVQQLTSHTAGYCYFDRNTGKFWIDTSNNAADMLQLGGTFFGTCSTTGSTAAKVINDCPGFVLYPGASIYVQFIVTNTASIAQLTLNVNGTGAKPIKRYGTTNLPSASSLSAGYIYNFVYDGTNWLYVGQMDSDTNTISTAYCDVVGSQAIKTAVCSGFVLKDNSYIHVLFTSDNANIGAISLNINSTGAKPIYINGMASGSSNYNLPAGTYLAYYDGTKYIIYTDGRLYGITTGNVTSITNDGSTIIYTKGDGTTASFVVPNTSYSAGSAIDVSNNIITNMGVVNVNQGSENGTISVVTGGTSGTTTKNVKVKGLGSAAYENTGAFAPASHQHGNISNLGLITNTAQDVGNGDAILVTDADDDSKLVKTTITFDGTTTNKFLTKAGTWANAQTEAVTEVAHAGSAGYATTASKAIYAASAGYVATAASALSAITASNAVNAASAITASNAITASRAFYANSAGYAATASVATTAANAVTAARAIYAASAGYATDNTKVAKVGDTMSGSLTMSKAGEIGVIVNNTTAAHQVEFIVGASGNGGMFDRTANKWIMYSNKSGNAEFAGHASCATYAASANSANHAVHAASATYVATAANSIHAASATYAASSKTASNAVTASYAEHAVDAGSALTAGSADTAGTAAWAITASRAIYAQSATYVTTAQNAVHAGSAGYAATALSATHAVHAASATYTTTAGNAVHAGTATYASSATYSTKALQDSDGKKLQDTYLKKDDFATALMATDAMQFKGTLGTVDDGGTIQELPSTFSQGDAYKIVTAGTYAGKVCEIGDLIIATANGTTSSNSSWIVIQTNIDGAVTGPASASDGQVALYNGTNGKVIKAATINPGSLVETVTFTPNKTTTLGTNISADDITTWTPNKIPTATVNNGVLIFYAGTTATLAWADRSIPNVTSVGTTATFTYTTASYVKTIA